MIPETLQRRLTPRGNPVRIAQLTDSHLDEAPGGDLLGMDTDASLSHVLDLIDNRSPPDLVLATGDLANHGSLKAYRRFESALSRITAPAFWLAGNHDYPGAMQDVFNEGRPPPRRLLIGNWQIILLDSTVPGQVGGTLGPDELDLLSQCLEDHTVSHTLVCMHHHPVPIGCAWLDEQRVSDADALLHILDSSMQVKAVLCGHVHQAHEIRWKRQLVITTPSTCIQFAPNSENFAVDELAPGLRQLALHADGRIETRVIRVEGVEFHFDRNSRGYL